MRKPYLELNIFVLAHKNVINGTEKNIAFDICKTEKGFEARLKGSVLYIGIYIIHIPVYVYVLIHERHICMYVYMCMCIFV